MRNVLKREYSRLRAKGWHAAEAMRAARVLVSFKRRESCDFDDSPPADARTECVRLRIVPDECASFEDLCGDMFEPRANPDTPVARLDRERADYLDKVQREGVCGIVAEFWSATDEEWQQVDSCYGFVGDDWQDSGYDTDLMRAALAARTESVRAYRNMCKAAP